MNATTSSSASRTSAPAPADSRDGDRRAGTDERDVADFERALRQRSQLQDKGRKSGREGQADTETETPLREAPPPPTTLPAPFALALAQAQGQQAQVEAAPPTRGLVEQLPAALRAELSHPTLPSTPEAARAFEVSLREPLGGGLTLHAVAPVAGSRWTLSIGAHGLNQQELRRNLGRLEQRLRDKAVPLDALDLHTQPDPSDDLP
jgi:hypothetical protein